jgi:ABC-type glycerol-3-phosphate transport system substrate-binding protein
MTRIPAYRTDMRNTIGYMPSMTKKKRATVFDGWVEAVVNHPDGKQQQAAYDLIAWHLKPEHLATRLEQTGNLPPRKAVQRERVFEQTLEKEPLQRQAMEELAYAKTFPMAPIMANMRTRIQEATHAIVIDGKPAKETLEAARKELDVRWQDDVLSKMK